MIEIRAKTEVFRDIS